MRSRQGFTLLEVVMALGLMALVVVAMNTFLFSMGELWGRQSEPRLFDLHVRGVTRFLTQELRSVTTAQGGDQGGFVVKEVRLQDGRTDPLVTFLLPSGSRLCNWPEGRPLPEVEAGLVFRERVGLVLVWKSRIEERFGEDPPRETIISPWVTGVSFDYYDDDFKNWKNESRLRSAVAGKYPVPERLRVAFAYDGRKTEVTILLPRTQTGVTRP